jgi:hypothetical protein
MAGVFDKKKRLGSLGAQGQGDTLIIQEHVYDFFQTSAEPG